MPTHLVRARPKPGKLFKLRRKLELGDIGIMRGFGRSLEFGLKHAKRSEEGEIIWEQTIESTATLSQEKVAILNEFFRDIVSEEVKAGEGWERIRKMRSIWGGLEP